MTNENATEENEGRLTSMEEAKEHGLRAMSDLLQRVQLAQHAGKQFGGKRDLYEIFGYPKTIKHQDLFAKYERQDIAARVVDAAPKATWSEPPVLTGVSEDFTKRWNALVRRHKLWSIFERADRLAGMGQFSGVLLGFNDGNGLKSPVSTRRTLKLLYMQVVGDYNTNITKFEDDTKSERFGKPREYQVQFDNPATKQFDNSNVSAKESQSLEVFWQRLIHVVENPLTDDVLSTPRLVKVYNLLEDILKVSGGTAETYWLTANRGMQADVNSDMELDEDDAKALGDELEEFQHQLRRIVRTRGVTLNNLGSETPSPGDVFEMLISLLSGATGIPKRILVGSEQGSLASEQDRANWADRIVERRASFAQPFILEPTVDRLIEYGILPQEEYTVEWPDAFKMSPLERAQTMAQKGRSAANFSKQLGKPILTQEESRAILGVSGTFPDTVPNPDDLPGDGNEPASTEGPVGDDPSQRNREES